MLKGKRKKPLAKNKRNVTRNKVSVDAWFELSLLTTRIDAREGKVDRELALANERIDRFRTEMNGLAHRIEVGKQELARAFQNIQSEHARVDQIVKQLTEIERKVDAIRRHVDEIPRPSNMPAPKKVWKDITKDCDHALNHLNQVTICRKSWGAAPDVLLDCCNYRIRKINTTHGTAFIVEHLTEE